MPVDPRSAGNRSASPPELGGRGDERRGHTTWRAEWEHPWLSPWGRLERWRDANAATIADLLTVFGHAAVAAHPQMPRWRDL